MFPMIGLTIRLEEKQLQLNRDYMEAVVLAGGIPVLIPYLDQPEALQEVVNRLDGLVLTGGEDIDPAFYEEEPHPELKEITPERDQLEMQVFQQFVKTNKPILGLCRGMQMINVAMGGDLYQDLPSQLSTHVNHSQKAPRGFPYHRIRVEADSLLYQIVQSDEIKINSYHHQAVRHISPSLKVSAKAADGVIEAIEGIDHPYLLGVQWHPEGMVTHDVYAKRIFTSLIETCLEQKKRSVAS